MSSTIDRSPDLSGDSSRGSSPTSSPTSSQGSSPGSSRVERWPGLDVVPTGPRTAVSAAVTRRLLTGIARRLGVRVVEGGEAATAALDGSVPTLHLIRPAEFYARVGRHGLIGFGEGYQTGAWDSPDLDMLLTTMAAEMGTLVPAPLQRMRKAYVARHPRGHRNATANTRRNIAHHYDLSNDLFTGFLDETMSYSSALFPTGLTELGSGRCRAEDPGQQPWSALAAAQRHKVDTLLDSLAVGPETRLLEIGSGWGELAIRAAQRGARVLTITLSTDQQALARERIAAAGVADRVAVELRDYRTVSASDAGLPRGHDTSAGDAGFDAIASVEMIEAVGHEFLPAYFTTIDRLLAPGGRAGIQAITMSHDRMLATLGTYTWINKYIFPGGFLPSPELIDDVLARHTSLHVSGRLDFGRHYAETLRLWLERFATLDTRPLGFDDTFDRMWRFYLTYSRAGFAADYLQVSQLLLTRGGGAR